MIVFQQSEADIPHKSLQSSISRKWWTLQLSSSSAASDMHICQIQEFLSNLTLPSDLSEGLWQKFLSNATNYFIKDSRL
jgi:hypothetical protein